MHIINDILVYILSTRISSLIAGFITYPFVTRIEGRTPTPLLQWKMLWLTWKI